MSSFKTEGEKVNTEKTSKKYTMVLRFEIHKRINRNIHVNITIVANILYTLNSNLVIEYWQHPLKSQIPARHS